APALAAPGRPHRLRGDRPRPQRARLHRPRARRRRRPALRDEVAPVVWRTLEDHLQVLYGAALALAIVVLLTPAVGGMARLVGIHQLPEWVGIPLSVVWIVGIMNMVNFLDGLDGLAAGVCAISAGTFSLIALSLGKPQAAITTAIVLGATLGFLRHNFYPARIFMGDSGALLLGFMLAAISIQS